MATNQTIDFKDARHYSIEYIPFLYPASSMCVRLLGAREQAGNIDIEG